MGAEETMVSKRHPVPVALSGWDGDTPNYRQWKHALELQISSYRWFDFLGITDRELDKLRIAYEIQKGRHEGEHYPHAPDELDENKVLMKKTQLTKKQSLRFIGVKN